METRLLDTSSSVEGQHGLWRPLNCFIVICVLLMLGSQRCQWHRCLSGRNATSAWVSASCVSSDDGHGIGIHRASVAVRNDMRAHLRGLDQFCVSMPARSSNQISGRSGLIHAHQTTAIGFRQQRQDEWTTM